MVLMQLVLVPVGPVLERLTEEIVEDGSLSGENVRKSHLFVPVLFHLYQEEYVLEQHFCLFLMVPMFLLLQNCLLA